jgi:hypothetical protein
VTELYLAHSGGTERLKPGLVDPAPVILCSYVYFQSMTRLLQDPAVKMRYWVLDSGAFTAHANGKPIELQRYIDFCHQQLASATPPREVYALDVIGDHVASARNAEEMWRQGVKAIPTFHIGEPEQALLDMAKRYPKIALGGVAGMGTRALPFLKQCFARVWPKRMHLFGIHSEDVLFQLPFESADSSNWQMTFAFGSWKKYGKLSGVRSKDAYIRPEVEYYLELERRLRHKWGLLLAPLKESA